MHDEREARPAPASGPSPEGRLDSWKEIAAYLGRGIRTVQRWEREEGLPVHRLAHDKRGSIYARREELTAWWESRRVTLAAPAPAAAAPAPPPAERVTRTSAITTWPALSSDARLAAYVSDGGQDGRTPQIWIQQIGGAALCLTDGEREYSHLSFSPDDTRIVFTAVDESGPNLYDVPALGGEPRLLQRGARLGVMAPDGRSLAWVGRDAPGIVIAAAGGTGSRIIAAQLVGVGSLTWLPDNRTVLVHARPDAALEPDWWIVPIDGAPPANTGLVARLFREAGLFTLPTRAAWMGDSLFFAAAGPQGVHLYRQRFVQPAFQPAGPPEQLTVGSDSASLPAAAAGRVAFLSSQADANLWSVALDPATGLAHGPLRRMTRGPGIAGYLSVTSDGRTLAYFSFRRGEGDVFLRDVSTGAERLLADGPPGGKSYPAISPDGSQVAFGTRVPGGQRALRPIFLVNLNDRTWRTLGDDCGGRPREWVDERHLVIERFARLNSIALIDTATGAQRELLASGERSISNARLSPDRRWIAFDASRPGESPSVCVAPFRHDAMPESEWAIVDRRASHPFWSADARLLYYTLAGTNPMLRSAVRARPFGAGPEAGDPLTVYESGEMMMPAYLPGTAPVATADQILLVLGDFRGDIWLMDLDPDGLRSAT